MIVGVGVVVLVFVGVIVIVGVTVAVVVGVEVGVNVIHVSIRYMSPPSGVTAYIWNKFVPKQVRVNCAEIESFDIGTNWKLVPKYT